MSGRDPGRVEPARVAGHRAQQPRRAEPAGVEQRAGGRPVRREPAVEPDLQHDAGGRGRVDRAVERRPASAPSASRRTRPCRRRRPRPPGRRGTGRAPRSPPRPPRGRRTPRPRRCTPHPRPAPPPAARPHPGPGRPPPPAAPPAAAGQRLAVEGAHPPRPDQGHPDRPTAFDATHVFPPRDLNTIQNLFRNSSRGARRRPRTRVQLPSRSERSHVVLLGVARCRGQAECARPQDFLRTEPYAVPVG